MKMKKEIKLLFACIFVIMMLPKDAYGYIDPGTGSYIIQIAIATILGSMFAIKIFWKKIVHFFRSVFNRNKNAGTEE